MVQSVGIVGTGIVGKGMARNLLKAGYSVHIWNRTPAVYGDLVSEGAIPSDTPQDVGKKSDVVIEVTATDESSRSVWTGQKGILSGASAQTILITSATLSVPWVDELIGLCRQRGYTFLDVPVTGGRIGAETGSLTLLIGGDPSVVADLQGVFGAIAKKMVHFGPAGSGMRYKLILNFMQALHLVGFAQAMKIAEAHGLDLEKVSAALADRPGGALTDIARRAYITEPDPLTFPIEWIVKDLSYAKQFAGSLDVSLLDAVLDVYRQALAAGFGKKDWARISRLV